MIKYKIIAFTLALCTAVSVPCYASTAKGPGADPEYTADSLPGVNWRMFDVNFWADGKDFGQCLMTDEQIENFNEQCFSNPDCCMKKLDELEPTFNGLEMRNRQASFKTPSTHYLNGTPVSESYYEAIRRNIRGAKVSVNMPLRYGICVTRTEIKSYPYSDLLSDSQDDPEWDDFVLSPLLINEPVAVYFATADGKWYLVQSEFISGWVPGDSIALCKNKEEFIAASNPENFLIVTGSSIQTEKTSLSSNTSQADFEMGTKLELCIEDPQMVNNRMSWYNYVVYIPIRNNDGSYGKEKALIPVSRDVSTEYLKLTRGDLLKQAFKCLGNRYGWGGMMNAHDCSSFVKQLYSCFGVKLPRNTTMQSNMNCKKIDMSEMTVQEKEKIIDTLPIGCILQFRGHEMLWIGKYENEYYTINDVSSLVIDDSSGNSQKYRVRDVIINGLNSTKRANGKTWMESVDLAIIPFE